MPYGLARRPYTEGATCRESYDFPRTISLTQVKHDKEFYEYECYEKYMR
jgi:hypothetical protein